VVFVYARPYVKDAAYANMTTYENKTPPEGFINSKAALDSLWCA